MLQDHQAFRRRKWKYLILDEVSSFILATYSSVSNRRVEVIEVGVFVSANLNRKRLLIEGGMHVGSFSIEKGC